MTFLLLKSEPSAFSIDDLRTAKGKTTVWDGVRNYLARNNMLDASIGDYAFFYHSNATPPGIVGLCQVTAVGVVDPTQFDETSKYFDPKSTKDNPRWHTIKVKYVETFDQMLSLDQLRETFTDKELTLLQKGSRLSVTHVDDKVADKILKIAGSNLVTK
jgi:predicted RNA-binding protein with PUA-like domain